MTIPKAWSVCKIRDIREVLQLPNLSLQFFVRTYPREEPEMVFDAHDRAFAFFKVACTRGIYDNMKTAGRRSSPARTGVALHLIGLCFTLCEDEEVELRDTRLIRRMPRIVARTGTGRRLTRLGGDFGDRVRSASSGPPRETVLPTYPRVPSASRMKRATSARAIDEGTGPGPTRAV